MVRIFEYETVGPGHGGELGSQDLDATSRSGRLEVLGQVDLATPPWPESRSLAVGEGGGEAGGPRSSHHPCSGVLEQCLNAGVVTDSVEEGLQADGHRRDIQRVGGDRCVCLPGDQADSLIPVSEHQLDRDQSIDASRASLASAQRGSARWLAHLPDGVGPAALQRVRQTEDAVEVGRVAEYTGSGRATRPSQLRGGIRARDRTDARAGRTIVQRLEDQLACHRPPARRL